MIGAASVVSIVAVMAGYFRYLQLESDNQRAAALAGGIQTRNSYVSRAVASDFKQSLLILLANLATIDTYFDKLGSTEAIKSIFENARANTIAALRATLARSPYFVGHYSAVGFDPKDKKVALLQNRDNMLLVAPLATSEFQNNVETPQRYFLPDDWQSNEEFGVPVVGFLDGLGVAVYMQETLYYWEQPGPAKKINLPYVRAWRNGAWPIAEFSGGNLIIKKATPRKAGEPGAGINWELVRYDGEMLKRSGDYEPMPIELPLIAFGDPPPIFSDVKPLQYYAAVSEGREKIRCMANTVDKDCYSFHLGAMVTYDKIGVELDKIALKYGQVGQAASRPKFIGVAPFRAPLERRPILVTFISGTNTVAVRGENENIWIDDLSSTASPTPPDSQAARSGPVTIGAFPEGADRIAGLKYAPGLGPWMTKPLAVDRRGNHWIAAWIAENGLWAAESTDANPDRADPILGGTLLTGEPGGFIVRVTNDGKEILLMETAGFGNPIAVRLFNLSQPWIDRIMDSEDPLGVEKNTKLACEIVRMEGPAELDPSELKVFSLRTEFGSPCKNIPGKLGGSVNDIVDGLIKQWRQMRSASEPISAVVGFPPNNCIPEKDVGYRISADKMYFSVRLNELHWPIIDSGGYNLIRSW
jgi:hypothetical protein